MIIKLRKPMKHNNQTFKELDLQLENLTANDLIDVEEEIIREKRYTMVSDGLREFDLALAARALRVPVEAVKQLDIRDCRQIITEVQLFLYDTDSNETDNQAETPETNPEISSEELQSN